MSAEEAPANANAGSVDGRELIADDMAHLQVSLVECARHVAHLVSASTTPMTSRSHHPIPLYMRFLYDNIPPTDSDPSR